MKFISLCPAKFALFGHREIYHLYVKKATEQLNLSHEAFLVNSSAYPKGWTLFFKADGNPWKRFREFLKIFRMKDKKKRIFFIEDFTTREFCALGFAAFFIRKKDHLWVFLRYGSHRIRFKGAPHFILLKILRKKMNERLVCLSDSHLICEDYETKLKQKVHLLPIPHIDFPSKSFALPKKPWVAWWPGQPRKEKGITEILHLMKNQEQKRENFSLVISDAVDVSFAPTFLWQRVNNSLTREEYLTLLEKATFILLPYDKDIYKQATSGIFVESIIAGKLPLVKEGSWLAFELKKYDLEELILNWESPFFFSRLEEIATNLKLQQKLNMMRKEYAAFHSLDSFAKKISDLISRS